MSSSKVDSIGVEMEVQMFVDDWLSYVSWYFEVPENEREEVPLPPCLALSKWLARGFVLPEYAIQAILAQLCPLMTTTHSNEEDAEVQRKVNIILKNAGKAFERECPNDEEA